MRAFDHLIYYAPTLAVLLVLIHPLRADNQNLNSSDITHTFSVFADTGDDGKLQDLQVTSVTPGSVMDSKYGLKDNDVIIAVIDAHAGRTEMNGLNNEQDAENAICKAVVGGGQLVIQRGDQQLMLPPTGRGQAPQQKNELSGSSGAAGNPDDAKIKLLESQLSALQTQLLAANTHCRELELTIAELRVELPAIPNQASDSGSAQDSSTFVALPSPHWQPDGTMQPQLLTACPAASAIKIDPCDPSLTAGSDDPAHVNLKIRKVSSGLGDVSEVGVAKIWLQGGSLMLQWTDQDSMTQGLEKLRFSNVRALDSSGNVIQRLSFCIPAAVSFPLDQDNSARLAVPASIATQCELGLTTVPRGWDLRTPEKSTIILSHSPAVVRISFDPHSSRISIEPQNIEEVDPQRRLASLQTQLATAERRLETAQQNYNAASNSQRSTVSLFGPSYTHTDTSESAAEIAAENSRIEKLKQWILQAEADCKSNSGPAKLDGAVVSLTLPNGVKVGKITLGSVGQ
jgi:hypothetical protein